MNPFESMPHRLTPVALVAMVLYAAGARAADPKTPMFSFSGFGTLGMVHSSEDKADFRSSIYKPNGAGHTRAWSADVDSLIGGQVTANFTPQLSTVLQVIAEQNYDNTYRPHVEWANVKYQITPDFSVRAGRIILPSFLSSETRKVSYTYPWVRPPLEVYGLVPSTNSDGLDVSYRLHFGDWANTVQINLGRTAVRIPDNAGTVTAKRFWGITNTGEHGPLTVRITFQKADVTVPAVNSLFDAFRQFGPQGVAIADKYDSNDEPFSFLGIGASYDPGKWFVTTEWGQSESDSALGKRSAWYASGGYRFGKFTPYVTYAHAEADNLSDPGLEVSALPPPLAGPASGLNAGLNAILRGKPVQNTVSVGTRWDFMKNAALKLQYDHTRIGAGSNGTLTNIQPGFQTGGRVNVFSASIDFVF
jgi:opacity protein-like surface antigen